MRIRQKIFILLSENQFYVRGESSSLEIELYVNLCQWGVCVCLSVYTGFSYIYSVLILLMSLIPDKTSYKTTI